MAANTCTCKRKYLYLNKDAEDQDCQECCLFLGRHDMKLIIPVIFVSPSSDKTCKLLSVPFF